jgi:hypothetical protein
MLVRLEVAGILTASALLLGLAAPPPARALATLDSGQTGESAQAGDEGDGPIEVDVPATDATPDWSGVTRNVPDQYPTIQSAVDAAEPGDLILVQPGVYREEVAITTESLTLRGVDRNAVILDGEFTRGTGVTVTADGVAVENMTARSYTTNGFFWTGVTGYRGSYLTAVDSWVYGIYAFDSVDGVFEHSYASGSWDAGFYVGQCDPCNAVVTDVVAEFNGLGYSGTNSSGHMYIVNSEWRNNVAGIAPNTLDSELLPPSHDVTIAGNYIHHNGEVGRAPSRTAEWSAYGNGVVLAGSRDSVVRNNLMVNNKTGGVQVVSMIDANLWRSGGNEVRDNKIRGSGRADLLLGGPLEQGSCFADNDAKSSVPYFLTWLHSCDGINLPLWYGLATSSDPLGRIAQAANDQNPQLEHGDAPKPDLEFEQLPGGADAPVRPAVNVFNGLQFDPSTIETPDVPAGVTFESRRPTVFGIVIGAGFWPVLYGALMWWVPMMVWLLGGAWVLGKMVLGRMNRARSSIEVALWLLVAVFLPVVGVLLFASFGNRQASLLRRLVTIGGGLVVWLGLTAGALLVGGVF